MGMSKEKTKDVRKCSITNTQKGISCVHSQIQKMPGKVSDAIVTVNFLARSENENT
jgi:hypothetical protein